ncbi:Crp/Fnr family transcriptional regulator [Catellatospora sp. TT07R-123]|uniref:Crp/Fnr family transcriptional regulator n=1 Tax=Catellatospora sp. TT07R-123 TaxID=2733863 RepID=UPI001B22F2FE|nr:Crp/Fnr family transcriptional regulator [Catellatospora sp. TT07R-123]GHJ47122.1 Crp/Fnr family transcriptional regulator [Catellatospora sp. TT07R-123]
MSVVSAAAVPWPAASFLGSLSDRDRQELLSAGVRRAIPPERRLLTEGEQSRHVELIERGFVKVTAIAADLTETVLAIRGPGDIVGELAAVSGNRRAATVTTCGRVVSVVVRRPAFEAFLAAHPAAAAQLTRVVGDRLLWANQRRADFASCPTKVRVARVLTDLIPVCGRPGPGGGLMVGLTQPELASMIGGKESAVHKALRELRAAGVIATGYGQIAVLDPHGLADLRDLTEAGFSPDR